MSSDEIHLPHVDMCLKCLPQEEDGDFARSDRIIDHMLRRSDEDFRQFCLALKKTSQDHVITDALGRYEAEMTTSRIGAPVEVI